MNPLDKLDLSETEQRIRTLCRGWGCPDQDLGDVVQEAFLLMAQGNPNVSNAASVAMRRICPRTSISIRSVDPRWLDEHFQSDSPSPDEHAEIREEIGDALGKLSGKNFEISRGLYEGRTLQNIADALGMTIEAVRWRIAHYQDEQEVESTGEGT